MFEMRSVPIFGSALVLCALSLALVPASAADDEAAAPARLAPPSSDLKDFAGYYRPDYLKPLVKSAVGTSGPIQTVDHQMPPFTPKASAEFNYRLSKEQAGMPVMDTTPQAGLPSACLVGFLSPVLVIANRQQMFFIFESGAAPIWRIHLDRDHPKKLAPSTNGDSVGHWEGNTLVVDTRGFNTSGHLDLVGTPFSRDLHTVTRISKINGGHQLEFLITVNDPENFTQPFTTRYTAAWRPDERLMENEIDAPPPGAPPGDPP
jgi:hypothetical protein